MVERKFYRKGVCDSTTKHEVLAVRRDSKIFSIETCYFDYVRNLSFGIVYVDCEK